MKAIGIVLVVLILVAVLAAAAFGLEWAGLKWKGYFAPKHEAVRREVFLETRSYNEGKVQELVKYRLEYMRSKTENDKAAIASAIRMGFAQYDESKLSPELRGFLRKIKLGQ